MSGALSPVGGSVSADYWFQEFPATSSIQSMTSCRSSRYEKSFPWQALGLIRPNEVTATIWFESAG